MGNCLEKQLHPKDGTKRLSLDLQTEICLYLDIRSLLRMGAVDKDWRKVFTQPRLFHDISFKNLFTWCSDDTIDRFKKYFLRKYSKYIRRVDNMVLMPELLVGQWEHISKIYEMVLLYPYSYQPAKPVYQGSYYYHPGGPELRECWEDRTTLCWRDFLPLIPSGNLISLSLQSVKPEDFSFLAGSFPNLRIFQLSTSPRSHYKYDILYHPHIYAASIPSNIKVIDLPALRFLHLTVSLNTPLFRKGDDILLHLDLMSFSHLEIFSLGDPEGYLGKYILHCEHHPNLRKFFISSETIVRIEQRDFELMKGPAYLGRLNGDRTKVAIHADGKFVEWL